MAGSGSVGKNSTDIWVGTSLGVLKGVCSATKHVNNYIPGSMALSQTDKMKEVCAMCWEYQSNEHLYCISRSGMVHCFNCLKRTFVATDFDCSGEDGQSVGLGKHEETIITCTNKGALSYRSSGTVKTGCSVGSHVSTMATSPDTLLQVATGGRENDLKLWDGHNLSAPIFQAKNVKNDKLDLRVPVWVSAVEFVPDSGVQPTIAVGTGYHEVRLYDTRAQRRPVFSQNFGEAPISALAVANDGRSFFIGNGVGELARFDTRTGGVVNQYKGFAGAVKCIQCYTDNSGDSQIAACGLDRYLRVYSVTPAKLICQVYLKLQSSSLLFHRHSTLESDSQVVPAVVAGGKRHGSETLSDSEGDDEDGVWKEMETVGVKSKKNTGSKKIKLSKSKTRTKR